MNAQTDIKSGTKAAPAFVTGRGQSDTHAVTLNSGEPNPSRHAGKPYSTITGREIAAMVKDPPAVPKEQGPWFIPSTYHDHDARSHDAQRQRGLFHWLALDVDQNNLTLDDVRGPLDAVVPGASKLIYTTRSATPETRKWRALIPLQTPIRGEDYHDNATAFFDLLEEASSGVLIPDRKLSLPGQLVYLPNRGAHYEYHLDKAARLDLTPDHPIMQRAAETRRLRAEAEKEAAADRARRAARRAAQAEDTDSPVDHFNQRHSVEDLLLRYGYKRAGHSQDYRSPAQSSGSYATRCYGEYWISLSGSDAANEIGNATANGNRFGDAFDLFVHFDHGGDFKRAVNAYAHEVRLLNPQRDEEDREDPLEGFEKIEDSPDVDDPPPPGGGKAKKEDDGDNWSRGLIVNSRGTPIFNTANVVLILREHEDMAGCFAFDEFRQAKQVCRPLPGSHARRKSFRPRDLQDHDVTTVVSWFNRNTFPMATKGIVADAIDAVAVINTRHPVREYLDALPEWDGVERIATWLLDYCAVAPADDAQRAYVNEAGKRWLISAIARIMRPGCKADGVLILEGKQGARKSTTLRILAGDDWFGDSLPNLQSKDASDYVRGKWIIEMAELSNMNKAEVEVVKAFISRNSERFRPAYGRNEITYERQCIFAGSTNKTDYLRDETGNRRFWPVKVGPRCDTDSLKRDRDQIWAEALKCFNAGEPWWLAEDIETTAREEQESRVAQDIWEGNVLQFLTGRTETSVAEVAKGALDIDIGRSDRATSNRVMSILIRNGWTQSGRFTAGENKGRSRFIRGGEE